MLKKHSMVKKESELEAFQQFSKKPLKYKAVNKPTVGSNCVIYTRVSSKRQEDGCSLELQLDSTQHYAEKSGFNIIGYFDGKYESAQTDKERKEFNKMLQFIKKSKEQVSYVLVYMVDRFSRTGINGAYIKESLRQEGVELIAVKTPVDTSNPGRTLTTKYPVYFQ